MLVDLMFVSIVHDRCGRWHMNVATGSPTSVVM
jgi:hypothetical protein